jgi:acyl carrier protein
VTEQKIARVWKDLLEVERVGLHDNFFELGGHSMIATVLVSRLRDLFCVEVSVRQLFEGPTVAELADRVDATRWAVESLEGATSAFAVASREEGTI